MVPKAEIMSRVEHAQGKWQNNRAENSHQPTQITGEGDTRVQVNLSGANDSSQPSASSHHISEWADTSPRLVVTEQ